MAATDGGTDLLQPEERRQATTAPATLAVIRSIGYLECSVAHALGVVLRPARPGYAAEKRYTVVVLYSWPGFSSVVGNFGWFGESGKCCVSRQKPQRRW